MSNLYTRPRYIELVCHRCKKLICYAYTRPEINRTDSDTHLQTDSINDGKHYTPYLLYCAECEQYRIYQYNPEEDII